MNPGPEFSEDGVAELWLSARHIRPTVTVDAVPMGWWARYKHGWKTAKFSQLASAIFALFVLAFLVPIGGLICLALWDLITGAH